VFTIKQANTLSADMALPLGEHTGYLLRVAHDRVHAVAVDAIPGGPHPRVFGLLTALLEAGPFSQQMLAEKMRVNRSLVVGIVDDLERRGWVERRRDPADRRSYQLHVTEEGRRARDEMAPFVRRANERVVEPLDADERTRLNALLRKFIATDPGRMIPAALAETPGFLITQAHWLARDRANEVFRDLPIEIRHYAMLTTLHELGPVSQQALTKAMRVSATTVTQMVDDLERVKLVERRRNPSDRRTYTVTMTPEGERVLAEGRTRAERFEIELDPELRTLLRKLVGD
jgi:DNA-binding MarR family transcriptional regulator